MRTLFSKRGQENFKAFLMPSMTMKCSGWSEAEEPPKAATRLHDTALCRCASSHQPSVIPQPHIRSLLIPLGANWVFTIFGSSETAHTA